jgi:hypothetical protein
MAKFTVQVKSSVYYETTIEAEDDYEARGAGEEELSLLLEKATLPEPLEWEGTEAWDVTEVEEED